MSTHTMIVGLTFLICLIAAAVLFSVLIKINYLRENLLSAAISICLSLIIGCVGTAAFCWYPYDFVSDIGVWNYLTPLLASLLIIASFFVRLPFAVASGTLLASVIGVWSSEVVIEFSPEVSPIINQVMTVLTLWGFAMGYRALSGFNPLPQSEAFFVSSGIVILYLLGMAPFMLAAGAAGLVGVMLIAYLYSASQPLGIESSPLLGFILGWLGLLCYGEYLGACFVIFAMLYLVELVVCVARRITLLPQYSDFAYNSASIQAFVSGFSAHAVIKVIGSTNILLLILGAFQINGLNDYSIPVFAGLVVAWQLYRMVNWQKESKTLKETNQELVRGIKESFDNFFGLDGKEQTGGDGEELTAVAADEPEPMENIEKPRQKTIKTAKKSATQTTKTKKTTKSVAKKTAKSVSKKTKSSTEVKTKRKSAPKTDKR